ncbi:isopentenyl-diphosphate Delta-isomerase [Actinoplanes sp. NPDC023801]|uniref:isopentenyl-diphosphate Delta-isomerase n=1 Tax=Actinoplanes sp. NPDC023801 TaxID=3154595 RepID=UPI0033DB59BC
MTARQSSPPGPAVSTGSRPASREADLVDLVDDRGGSIGTATVLDAHEVPGMLHRAFSVFLRDPAGRVLIQQRAAVKTRFPLRWGNTCCGHPAPGEPVTVSAGRRVAEEIGVEAVTLREVGVYVYYAEDPATGRVEREYDHVLLGDLPDGTEMRPDPAEVAELRWVTVPDLLADLDASPAAYAPWLEGVTRRLAAHLDQHPVAAGNSPAPVPSAPERSGGK